MTIILRINGFHNCDGCSRKVRNALRRIGVELVELDREIGNVTIASAENPEIIRSALERQLNKSVVVLSAGDLVPTNQNPNSVPANRALYLPELGQVAVSLAQVLDGVEVTRSNTTRINFIHRQTPQVEYAPPRPPPRSPPWMTTEPSAPLMPVAEQPVYGYPRDYYYGMSTTCRSHDHPNGCCNIM